MTRVIVITTEPLAEIPRGIDPDSLGTPVGLLDLSSSSESCDLPEGWERLEVEHGEADMFRRDFLAFLEAWPQKPLIAGKTFDSQLYREGGYSLWWTSVGAMRTASNHWVRHLRMIWRMDRVMKREGTIDRVIIHTASSEHATTLGRRSLDQGIPTEFTLQPSRRTQEVDAMVTPGWLLTTLFRLAIAPIRFFPRAFAVRCMSAGFQRPRSDRSRPTVVFRPHLSRLVRVRNGKVKVAFWERFLEEVRTESDIRTLFILRPKLGRDGRWRMVRWLRETGRELLRTWPDALPPSERYSAFIWWLCAIPLQLKMLFRFYGLRRNTAFASSFVFAGTDIRHLVIPQLKKSVEEIAEWEREVGRVAISFQKAGNVKAVFALAEFYPGSMKYIEAAQRLGIPAIGAQHGTIHPQHYVYTIPNGHVERAPTPDFFAAYGEYSTEIVSDLGQYPRERVWEVGAPRMDQLVNQRLPTGQARRSLQLPKDVRVVLVATHTYRAYPWFREVVRATLQLTAGRRDVIVCIKPHPGDMMSMDIYRSQAEEAGNTSVRFFEDNFDELLAACDVLISGSSTTIMEATLCGKKTICANFSCDADNYPYVEDGASLPAHDPSELQLSLERILSGQQLDILEERRDEFLRRHLGPTADGAGAAALSRHVMELVSRQTTSSDASA